LIEVEVDLTPKSIASGEGGLTTFVQAVKNKIDIKIVFFILEVVVSC
jgi:hypothetical protein